MRGTVSIGKFFLLKRNNGVLLVGPAVNDAAQSYEHTDWIGISASPSASLTLEQENTIDSLLNVEMSASIQGRTFDLKKFFQIVKDSFINHDIPTKDRDEKNGWALSWPIFFDSGGYYHNQDDVNEIFGNELSYHKYQQTSISKEVYRKFKNTKDFFDYVVHNKGLIDCDSLFTNKS